MICAYEDKNHKIFLNGLWMQKVLNNEEIAMHSAVELSILTLGNYLTWFLCPYIFRLVHCERIHTTLLHFLSAAIAEGRMAGLYTDSTVTMSTLRHRNCFLRCIHSSVPVTVLKKRVLICTHQLELQLDPNTHLEQGFTDFNVRKSNLVCLLKMPLRPHLGTN